VATPRTTGKKVSTPKVAPRVAQAPARKPRKPARASSWEPLEIPQRKIGRPEDPRLAAALAARERWHGRSGRPALKSATQAVAFVRERRLVHPLAASALPNLLDPVVGRATTGAERSGGPPAATLGAWMGELAAAPDLLQVRLCFEQPTLVQQELWPSLVAVAAAREEVVRAELTAPAAEALEILERKGVVSHERLRQLLGTNARDLSRVVAELEARVFAISRPDLDEEDRPITVMEPFARWAPRAVPGRRPDLAQAWTLLFASAARSAVVLWPEEIAALLPWNAAERDAAVRATLDAGAAVTYNEGPDIAFVASPVPR
jgi:hypothetical protein